MFEWLRARLWPALLGSQRRPKTSICGNGMRHDDFWGADLTIGCNVLSLPSSILSIRNHISYINSFIFFSRYFMIREFLYHTIPLYLGNRHVPSPSLALSSSLGYSAQTTRYKSW